MGKKYVLVLGGGGAKGSYQLGVWKALKEMNVKLEGVIGTSVGALNALLIAQDKFDEAFKLWKDITIDKIVVIPKELLQNGNININRDNFDVYRAFQKEFINKKGLDTTPLKKIVESLINEDKLREKGFDFGIVTYELNNMKPVEIFIEDIPFGYIDEYIMGSSALPGFKSSEIDGKHYVDGGFHNNVPFSVAKERGYKSIIVVDISSLGLSKKYEPEGTDTIYIKNSFELCNVLDFTPDNFIRNTTLGYLDTLKIYGEINGIKYFYKENNEIILKLENILFSDDIYKKALEIIDKKNITADLVKTYKKQLPKELYNYKRSIIAYLECSCFILNIEPIKLYNFDELLKFLWNEFENARINKKSEDKIKDMLDSLQLFNPLNLITDNGNNFYKELLFKGKKSIYPKIYENFLPALIPAKIFYIVLQKYFS